MGFFEFILDIKSYIFLCVWIWFLFCILIVVNSYFDKYKVKQYNDGICLECGGEYEYFSVVSHLNNTRYIYKCNKCNNVVELSKMVKEVE